MVGGSLAMVAAFLAFVLVLKYVKRMRESALLSPLASAQTA